MILFIILNLILLNVFDLLLYLRICICWCWGWSDVVLSVGGLCGSGRGVRVFGGGGLVLGLCVRFFVLVMGRMNRYCTAIFW